MWIVAELDGDLRKLGGIKTGGEEHAEVGPSRLGSMVFEDGDGGDHGGFIIRGWR